MTTHTTPLRLENLSVTLPEAAGGRVVLSDLSLELRAGEVLGIVGESGSGKTTLGLACLGLLPQGFSVAGDVYIHGTTLRSVAPGQRYRLRGRVLGYVPQEPMKALNPGMSIAAHVAEGLPATLTRAERAERAARWLAAVGLADGLSVQKLYPHALSGGQRQRVLLAAALAAEPDVLIADEFTTALDPATRELVVSLIREQVQVRGMSVVMISHDLELVARATDRLLVLRHGVCVEHGETKAVIAQPSSPYLQSLLALSLHFTPRAPLSLFPRAMTEEALND
ncbi:ATP-binding cassette domain-containing protein [Acetobacter thailandicus]|uniref:ATP-binding cassette domain-containing protein n=1 Tax=Acetobacter thailandicus TaxID=1502842 RepID=UPI001BA85E03|nr:ABC transporter ATP-binding protein [Acetobacter thailandicus]